MYDIYRAGCFGVEDSAVSTEIHSCGYHCKHPKCIETQRNYLVEENQKLQNEIERLKQAALEERAKLVEELNYSSNKLWDLAQAIRERATEEFTSCNPHPNAPHGFNRTASHNEGRYVCDCEYWKEDQE